MHIPFLNDVINRRLANSRILRTLASPLLLGLRQSEGAVQAAALLRKPTDLVEAEVKDLSLGDLLTTLRDSYEHFFDKGLSVVGDPPYGCSTCVKLVISYDKSLGLYKPETIEVGDIPENEYKRLWYLAREVRARKTKLKRVLAGGKVEDPFHWSDKRSDGISLFNRLVDITKKGTTFDVIRIVHQCTSMFADDIFNTNPKALDDYNLFRQAFNKQFQRVLTDSLVYSQEILNLQNPDTQRQYKDLYDSASGGTDQRKEINLSEYDQKRKEQIGRVIGQLLAPANNLLALILNR